MAVLRAALIWMAVGLAIGLPMLLAANSPLLQWRDPVYIVAGFAGVIAMGLLVVQPLLVGGYMPGLTGMAGRRTHRFVGGSLVLAVIVHVAGLWITSPPDVVDALLFMSPTPFSAWGVIAMWAVFAAAVTGVLRKRMGARLRVWRVLHTGLVATVVVGTGVHAVQIEGTMEPWSKAVLAILIVGVLIRVILVRRAWSGLGTARGG